MKSHSPTTIDRALAATSCPACDARKLSFLLRCDLAYGECLNVAKCEGCGTNYLLGAETLSLANDLADSAVLPANRLSPLGCPRCRTHSIDLGFQCELKSRSCFYTLRCLGCGANVKELGG